MRVEKYFRAFTMEILNLLVGALFLEVQMTWEEAKKKIEESIVVGTDLNTCRQRTNDRKVVGLNKINEEFVFKVKIGEENTIKIAMSLLEECFLALSEEKIYNGKVMRRIKTKCKPCLVHSVGKIFVRAGIVEPDEKQMNYYLLGK